MVEMPQTSLESFLNPGSGSLHLWNTLNIQPYIHILFKEMRRKLGSRLDGAIQVALSSNSTTTIDRLMTVNSGKDREDTRSVSNGTREREQPKDRTAKRRGSGDDAL